MLKNLDVIIKTGKNQRKKENNSKNEWKIRLIHSLTSMKSLRFSIFTFSSSKMVVLKADIPIQKFFWDKKIFSEGQKKFLAEWKKLNLWGKLCDLKISGKFQQES